MDVQRTVPAVVLVAVSHDPGPWFDEVLASWAAQDYPNLSVVLVDVGSHDDLTPGIKRRLPEAVVHRLATNPGFSAAANTGLGLAGEADFFVVCHDDVALAPDVVRLLVEEAHRSDAGIVGPKLVAWEQPDRLLQVGLAVDKAGVATPLVESGELDQEQHDAVRDVFAVSGGCLLLRADLASELAGFDPALSLYGEDVDLSWRAAIAGARTVVAPAARVRHRQGLAHRRPDLDGEALLRRHRLRTLLKCYGPIRLVMVVAQLAIAAVVGLVHALIAGSEGQAREIVQVWAWNLGRLEDLRLARRATQRLRRAPDREVRRLQVRGSARLTGLLRGQRATSQRLAGAGRQLVEQLRGHRTETLVWLGALLVLGFGSRELLLGQLPAVGELVPFPDRPSAFLTHFISGWRFSGLGSPSPNPTAFGLLGLAGLGLLGGMGLLQKLVVLGIVPLGAVGMWRLTRPLATCPHLSPGAGRALGPLHRLAPLVAPIVYLAIPLPYNALAAGGWSSLIAYAALPFLVSRLMRACGLPPFSDDRSLLGQALAFGLVLAAAAAFVPFLAFLVVVSAAALVLGSLVAGRVFSVTRALLVALAGMTVAFLLCLPWASTFLSARSGWSALGGVQLAPARGLGLGAILRFQTGTLGAAPLGWVFVVVGSLPLLLGRDWRLEWAIRLWFVALTSWLLAWMGGRGWLPAQLPSSDVLLVPAAVSMAACAGLGLVAVEADLREHEFGFPQLGALVVCGVAVLGLFPVLGASFNGRWHLPRSDLGTAIGWIREERPGDDYRILWLGDPGVLPSHSWPLGKGLAYALSRSGPPTAFDLWPPPGDAATAQLPSLLATARGGGTSRMGHLLAPMGIRFVVVAEAAALTSERPHRYPVPDDVTSALAAQLDLRRRPADPSVVVYENVAAAPLRALLPPGTSLAPGAAQVADLSTTKPVLGPRAVGRYEGVLSPGTLLVSEAASSGWNLTMNGRGFAPKSAFGWANGFAVDASGTAVLTYHTPLMRRLLLLAQVLAWVVVVGLVARRRPARTKQFTPVPAPPASARTPVPEP